MADPISSVAVTGMFIDQVVGGISGTIGFFINFINSMFSVMFTGGIYTFLPLLIILIVAAGGAIKYAFHNPKGIIVVFIIFILIIWAIIFMLLGL